MVIQSGAIGLPALLAALLGLREGAQRLVPFGFQRVGDQAVVGVDLHIPSARQIALVARLLDLLAAQPLPFLGATLQLLLDRQCDLQRQRRDRFDQQLANGLVQCLPVDLLADRLCPLDAPALAHVIGHPALALHVIAYGHAFAA